MTTFIGSTTAKTLGEVLFNSSLSAFSNLTTSIIEFLLVTPTLLENFLIEDGVYPLRRNPEIVGILGSSHPSTCLSSTSFFNFLLLKTVKFMFKRANSICCG